MGQCPYESLDALLYLQFPNDLPPWPLPCLIITHMQVMGRAHSEGAIQTDLLHFMSCSSRWIRASTDWTERAYPPLSLSPTLSLGSSIHQPELQCPTHGLHALPIVAGVGHLSKHHSKNVFSSHPLVSTSGPFFVAPQPTVDPSMLMKPFVYS